METIDTTTKQTYHHAGSPPPPPPSQRRGHPKNLHDADSVETLICIHVVILHSTVLFVHLRHRSSITLTHDLHTRREEACGDEITATMTVRETGTVRAYRRIPWPERTAQLQTASPQHLPGEGGDAKKREETLRLPQRFSQSARCWTF